MENLNKENFWNELYHQYPYGVQVFCDWIDKYKAANDWDGLFKNNYTARSPKAFIKYHDVPLAFQIGIWIQFEKEINLQTDFTINNIDDFKEAISATIFLLNEDKLKPYDELNTTP